MYQVCSLNIFYKFWNGNLSSGKVPGTLCNATLFYFKFKFKHFELSEKRPKQKIHKYNIPFELKFLYFLFEYKTLRSLMAPIRKTLVHPNPSYQATFQLLPQISMEWCITLPSQI